MKKIIILVLSLVILVSFYKVNDAVTASENVLTHGKEKIAVRYKLRHKQYKYTAYNYGTEKYLYMNNEVAFCVDPATISSDGAIYTPEQLVAGIQLANPKIRKNYKITSDQLHNLKKAIFWGWDMNESKTLKNYVYTKLLVWEAIGFEVIEIGGSLSRDELNSLRNKVYSYNKNTTSFHNTTQTIKAGETISLTDTNHILPYLNFENKSGWQFEKNGNTLKITATNQAVNSEIAGVINRDIGYRDSKALFYRHATSQNLTVVHDPAHIHTTLHLNVIKYGNVEITKIDAENKQPLQNVVFALMKNNEEISRQTTNHEGKIVFSNIEYGEYIVKEITPLENYEKNTKTYSVIINENQQNIQLTIENKRKKGRLEVFKVAKHNDEPLKDVVFELYQNNQLIQSSTTNQAGIARFENLDFGKYQLKEKSTLSHYFNNSKIYDIIIDNSNKNVEIVVKNEKIPIIQTQAYGENLKPLEHVEPNSNTVIFEEIMIADLIKNQQYRLIINGKDPISKQVIVDKVVEFIPTTNIHHVKYSWVVNGFELKNGIVFDEVLERKQEDKWVKKIHHNKEHAIPEQTITFKKTGTVVINKIDSTTQQKIKRYVKFGIYFNNQLIAEKESDDGEVKFENLIVGKTYQVKELLAPIGYLKSDEILDVTVKENEVEKHYEYQNHLLPLIKKSVLTNDITQSVYYAVLCVFSGLVLWFYGAKH